MKQNIKGRVRAYTRDGEIAGELYSIQRQRDRLIIDCKALGVMRMDIFVSFEDVLRSVGLLFCWPIISFVLLIPYFSFIRLFNKLRKEPIKKV